MGQITEKTASVWMAEFNRHSGGEDDDGTKGFEYILGNNATFASSEPTFLSFLIIIMDKVKFENPITAAMFGVSIYAECRRRQDEADKLTQEMH